jgi:membrane protein YdbS with pleckstrin-like domain
MEENKSRKVKEEVVLMETRPQPMMGYLMIGGIALAWLVLAVAFLLSMGGFFVVIIAMFSLGLLRPTLTALNRMVEVYRTRYVVTNKKVEVHTRGLLYSEDKEMPIRKIENVELKRNALNDALKFSTVIVQGTGGGLLVLMWAMDGPEAKKLISDLVEELHEKGD